MNIPALPAAARPDRPGWKEIAAVAAGLALLVALQLLLADALGLFQAHFWLDELFTHAIVADADLPHATAALANGVDTNPPTLHFLLRGFSALLGGPSEGTFRCFALLAMFAALLGLYLVLREVFPPLPALAGVLTVWCHPLILRHAFEARFYGPWLAGLVWFAYCLARSLRAPRQLGWLAAVAGTSVFVCTIHYFGVIALGLVALFVAWAHRPWSRRHLLVLAAVALGPLALAVCLPFYFGQRAALTVGTWCPRPDLLGTIAGLAPLLVVVCLYRLRELFARLLPTGCEPGPVLALVGLALLPSALTLFSLTVQPATMARYVLPSLAALAPVTAFAALLLPRSGRVALCLALAACGAWGLHDLANLYRQRDRRTDALIAAIRALPPLTPVVFEYTNALYVIDHYAPDLRHRCFFLDFECDQLLHASDHRITTRDVARRYVQYRGHPALMAWTHFTTLPQRYVVPGAEPDEPLADAQDRFPGFTLRAHLAGLHELTPAAQASR